MSKYCLSWDNHSTNVILNLTKFYENQQLLDITLSCENQKIGVHKCILMAGSLYFKEHLQKNSDTRIIAMKTIHYKILKLLIEFMYRGEIFVNEEDLNSLLVAAKFFKICGLNGIKLDDLTNGGSESYHIEEPEFIRLTKDSETNIPEVTESLSSDTNVNLEFHTELNSVEHEVVINSVNEPLTSLSETVVEAVQTTDIDKCSHIEVLPENPKDSGLDENVTVPYVTDTIVEEAPYEEFGTEEYIEEHLESMDENDYNDSGNEDPLSQDIAYSTTLEQNYYKGGPEINKKEAMQVLQEAGIPTDVPIFCEDGDGKFVELTQDIVEEIASGGQVIYQVVDEDGNAGELLLGSAVKNSQTSSRQEFPLDTQTQLGCDRLAPDDLYPNIPLPADSMIHLSSENEPNPQTQRELETENENKTSIRASRDRKMNSRYFNSNLTSPFLELRQKRGHKRKQCEVHENDTKFEKQIEIKKEVVESIPEFCDIEQRIAQLHAENNFENEHVEETVVTTFETVNNYTKDDGNILKVLSDGEIDKTVAKKRQLYHPNKNKIKQEPQVSDAAITCDAESKVPRRKTSNDDTSDASSQSTTSKEIPYALGLLPLQKALKKIQDMPDHTPRKTRSNLTSSSNNKSSDDATNGFDEKEMKNGACSSKKIESDKYDVLKKKRK